MGIRPRHITFVVISAFLCVDPRPSAQSPVQPIGTLVSKEVTLASLPMQADLESVMASDDGDRTAYIVKKGTRRGVVVDGASGPDWDEIPRDSLSFSPDSRHFAYVARKDKKWHAVVDGDVSKAWDEIGGKQVRWRPGTGGFGYCARAGRSWRAVIDGREGTARDERLAGPIFSHDGGRVAFITGSSPNFGSDRRMRAVIDNVESPKYFWVNAFWFSPDGRRTAFSVTTRGLKLFLVIDGEAGPEFDFLSLHVSAPPEKLFSRDGRRTAYIGQTDNKTTLVVDGKIEREVDGDLGRVTFSADGKHLGYWYALRHKWWQLTKDARGEVRVVVDGQDGPVYRGAVDGPVFSSDGSRVAYAGVRENGATVVVVDGQERQTYGAYAPDSLMFSADGAHLAYFAGKNDKTFLVLDGIEGRPYSAIRHRPVAFTQDSQHVLYVAKEGDGMRIVVDSGIEGPLYDAIGAAPGMLGPHSFFLIARRGRDILRVEVEVDVTPRLGAS